MEFRCFTKLALEFLRFRELAFAFFVEALLAFGIFAKLALEFCGFPFLAFSCRWRCRRAQPTLLRLDIIRQVSRGRGRPQRSVGGAQPRASGRGRACGGPPGSPSFNVRGRGGAVPPTRRGPTPSRGNAGRARPHSGPGSLGSGKQRRSGAHGRGRGAAGRSQHTQETTCFGIRLIAAVRRETCTGPAGLEAARHPATAGQVALTPDDAVDLL